MELFGDQADKRHRVEVAVVWNKELGRGDQRHLFRVVGKRRYQVTGAAFHPGAPDAGRNDSFL